MSTDRHDEILANLGDLPAKVDERVDRVARAICAVDYVSWDRAGSYNQNAALAYAAAAIAALDAMGGAK